MIIVKYFLAFLSLLALFISCEEVITVDLNSADPAFVVEAIIVKDSVCRVRLTRTTSYFSQEKPGFIDDATIIISDGSASEMLDYIGEGYYVGETITGTEERTYGMEIVHDGISYEAVSTMPRQSDIVSVRSILDNSTNPLNPFGKSILTLSCQFKDSPDIENYYMISFISEGILLESYFPIDPKKIDEGVNYNASDSTITLSESIFYTGEAGNEVVARLYTIDKTIYTYFMQLNDVLFWKRRIIPPTPFNPTSNISNGALGYFAAWAVDAEGVVLE